MRNGSEGEWNHKGDGERELSHSDGDEGKASFESGGVRELSH